MFCAWMTPNPNHSLILKKNWRDGKMLWGCKSVKSVKVWFLSWLSDGMKYICVSSMSCDFHTKRLAGLANWVELLLSVLVSRAAWARYFSARTFFTFYHMQQAPSHKWPSNERKRFEFLQIKLTYFFGASLPGYFLTWTPVQRASFS